MSEVFFTVLNKYYLRTTFLPKYIYIQSIGMSFVFNIHCISTTYFSNISGSPRIFRYEFVRYLVIEHGNCYVLPGYKNFYGNQLASYEKVVS